MIWKLKALIFRKDGLTLIELIISIAILGLIIIPFLNTFVFSTTTNKKSADVLEATYIVQDILERRHEESRKGGEIPSTGKYPDSHGSGYWIHEFVDVEENLVRLIVKVYADEGGKVLKSQMETYLLWNLN